MKEVVTKIGDVEITPGICAFLCNMLTYDIDAYIVSGYIRNLLDVQNLLTKILLDLEDPDPVKVKSSLSTVISTIDQLNLLLK